MIQQFPRTFRTSSEAWLWLWLWLTRPISHTPSYTPWCFCPEEGFTYAALWHCVLPCFCTQGSFCLEALLPPGAMTPHPFKVQSSATSSSKPSQVPAGLSMCLTISQCSSIFILLALTVVPAQCKLLEGRRGLFPPHPHAHTVGYAEASPGGHFIPWELWVSWATEPGKPGGKTPGLDTFCHPRCM